MANEISRYLSLRWISDGYHILHEAPDMYNLINPTMKLHYIPQYTIQNRNVHMSLMNGTLCDVGQVHSGICESGQLGHEYRKTHTLKIVSLSTPSLNKNLTPLLIPLLTHSNQYIARELISFPKRQIQSIVYQPTTLYVRGITSLCDLIIQCMTSWMAMPFALSYEI